MPSLRSQIMSVTQPMLSDLGLITSEALLRAEEGFAAAFAEFLAEAHVILTNHASLNVRSEDLLFWEFEDSQLLSPPFIAVNILRVLLDNAHTGSIICEQVTASSVIFRLANGAFEVSLVSENSKSLQKITFRENLPLLSGEAEIAAPLITRPLALPLIGTELYSNLPGSALTNLLKMYLNNPTRIESPRPGRIVITEQFLSKDTIITYKGNDGEYTLTIERVKELFMKRVQNGAKIFNFILEKLNEQHFEERTEFLLSELVEMGIYSNPDSAYRGLKTVLDKLMRIHIEGTIKIYETGRRKERANLKAALIANRFVSYNQCYVTLASIVRQSAGYITIMPKWSYGLQSDNAFILLDYIYYLARQNAEKLHEQGFFNISLDAIRQHLGLPSPEEVKENHGRNYNILIVTPIEDAVTAIEEGQKHATSNPELTITPVYNHEYASIHEYLRGYLEIRLVGSALMYMEQRSVSQLEETKKSSTKRRKKADQTDIT